jgi:beta-lactamase regulating signal transducer with metallopeptidase domain/general stress protein YciG
MTNLLEVCISNATVATLVALVAGTASKLCRRPALTHTLWLLVLLKLITPPIVRVPVVWQTRATSSDSATAKNSLDQSMFAAVLDAQSYEPDGASGQIAPAGPATDRLGTDTVLPSTVMARFTSPDGTIETAAPSIRWDWAYSARAIMWVWGAGSACWFMAAVARMVQFHQLLRHGKPASSSLQEQGARIARRLELGRCPELWIVPGRVSPLLWALGGRARLVLPCELLESLAPEQRATLLAHELAHARRRDHWVRWVEFVALGLYWWHPVAWLARRAIHQAEEQCCDAWVVWALPGRARAYAEALLETVGFLSGVRCAVPSLASGIGHVQLLRRRLTMILRETLSPRVSWRVRLMPILFGMFVLPIAPYHLTATAAEPGVAFDYELGSQSDREMRDLERRLDALEKKLDRVIGALEASRETAKTDKPAGPAKKSSADDEPAPAKTAKTNVDIAKKHAAAARAEAARVAQEARHAGERARRQAEKVDPDEFAELGRQIAESIRGGFDPERMAEIGRQIGEAVNTGVDPEQMAEIGRQIGEAVSKGFDPKQMEELGRQIEQAVNENFSPERMKEFERRIEETVKQSLDSKQLEQLGKQIERTMNENLSPGRMKDLEQKIEQSIKKNLKNVEIEIDEDLKSKPNAKSDNTKPEPRKPTKRSASDRSESTRSEDDTNPDARQFERRMRTLEQKMDRLLDALESRSPAGKR